MAVMYPEIIDELEGVKDSEKTVFRFIKEAARPQNDYICWYKPPLINGTMGNNEKGPDFIIFSRKFGLLVIDVNQWKSSDILSCNPRHFTVLISGSSKKRPNPDRQARGHLKTLEEIIKGISEFMPNNPGYKGRAAIPVARLVIFSSISREEFDGSKYKWFLEPEMSLFKDDLDTSGDIFRDKSGRNFKNLISRLFPFPYQELSQKQIDKLCFTIWPEAKIDLPERSGTGKVRFQKELMALDESQSKLAEGLVSGHQIIKGPPGSGKTLVLIHRCCHLYKYNAGAKRMLLVCYNIALVNYLKGLFLEKGITAEDSGIHVFHFFELCSKIIGEPVHFENEEQEYYRRIIERAMNRAQNGKSALKPYDAIFIDEAQDLSNEMLKTVLALLGLGGDLVIGVDPFQDIYRRKASWRSLGINAKGRTHSLKKAYRNTKEIFEFTQRFIGGDRKTNKQIPLFSNDFDFHGEQPEIRQFRSFEEIEGFLADDILTSMDRDDYKRSEIAVIYDDKVYGLDRFSYDNRALPMTVLTRLETSGIPCAWVSRDVRAKEGFDLTRDEVSLISVHSSKGMDFDLVYFLGIDHIRPTETTHRAMNSLVYVALTRAKYRLVVPYVEETEIIKRLKSSLPAQVI